MAGWALLLAAGAASLAGLWRLGFPSALRSFALAAAMLAAAGYAWQGRPALAGKPATAMQAGVTLDDDTVALRSAMFGRFGAIVPYLTVSDALLRFGAAGAAAQFVQAGISREPDSVALWTQLGILIATRDKAVSPAAAFAFRRAIALGPGEPAPAFFMGLAYVRSGEFEQGRAAWARALAVTPPGFAYRPAIAMRLALLDRLLAER